MFPGGDVGQRVLDAPFADHTGKQHLSVSKAGERFLQKSAFAGDLVKEVVSGHYFDLSIQVYSPKMKRQ